MSGKGSSLRGCSSTVIGSSDHSTKPTGVQEMFEHSQTYGLIFGWSCMEPGVGLDDPLRSLPIWDIL